MGKLKTIKKREKDWYIPILIAVILDLFLGGSSFFVKAPNVIYGIVVLLVCLVNVELMFLSTMKFAKITKNDKFQFVDNKFVTTTIGIGSTILLFKIGEQIVKLFKNINWKYIWEQLKIVSGPIFVVIFIVLFIIVFIKVNRMWAEKRLGKDNVN
jgi:hypothetical protein